MLQLDPEVTDDEIKKRFRQVIVLVLLQINSVKSLGTDYCELIVKTGGCGSGKRAGILQGTISGVICF